MAATRVKRPKYSDPSVRLHRPGGALLALLAALFIAALLSYSSKDPSFNHATDGAVHNLIGLPGAVVADLALQMTGVASLWIILALAAWGWRLWQKETPSLPWLRVIAGIGALLCLAAALALLQAPSAWPLSDGLGGAIGVLLKSKLAALLPTWLLGLVMTALFLGLGLYALALSREEWEAIGEGFAWLGGRAMLLFDLVRDALRGRAEGWDEPDAPASRPKRRRKPEEEEEALKPASFEGKISRSEKAQPRKQASLELRPRKGEYAFPPFTLLKPGGGKKKQLSDASLEQNAKMLAAVLQDFGVQGEIVNIRPGPVVTLYELEPSPGTKSSRVVGLSDDISRSMSSVSARIAVIPGRNAIGIELPNRTREMVFLRDLLEDESATENKLSLPLALGRDIGGDPVIADLARMPHLLVAGTTGSGKSVAINTMILSLAYHLSPEQCRFIMIDPKMLELSVYEGIPHLLTPVVTEPGKAVVALKWTVKEMENRYRLMATLGVRNIDSYNKRIVEAKKNGEILKREVQTGFDPDTGRPIFEQQEIEAVALPFIVVIVDEMADLMLTSGKEIESSIQRLSQMARAAGIHIIMATQRPSVDVITGVIKANFPTRISFQVTSKIDSRTILGDQGAEQLLGQGDMLFMAGGGRIIRVHGPFVSDKEVEDVVTHLKAQGEPVYVESVTVSDEDDAFGLLEEEESEEDKMLYDRAVQIVLRDRKASTSYVQRVLKIGYNRAARIIEKMEREGLVGPANAVGKREVLARD